MNKTSETSTGNSMKHFVPEYGVACALISQYGSPLYVYDASVLEQTIASVEKSISYPRTQFAFAAVTNGNVHLLRKFRDKTWLIHANTPGDAFLALQAGFAGGDIVYSGSNLKREEMRQMLDWGVSTFNLDSVSQLRLLGQVVEDDTDLDGPVLRIGFRLNLPAVTGESRIGISPDELGHADVVASEFGLEVSGVHFYRGTSTNATQRFEDCIPHVMEAGARLRNWRYLDFGGGFGFAYFDRNQSFEWSDFGRSLSSALNNCGRDLDLIIEPGRSIIAGCAVILSTVVSVKNQANKQIVGVDATTSNVAVLSVHGGVRQARLLRPGSELVNTDVVGNTTYSRDYLARNLMLPRITEGDLLAILDCGAYGYAMSSHFLHRPRLAEVLIESGAARLIRHRETHDCLLRNQVGFEQK